jgi:hypothetical protein
MIDTINKYDFIDRFRSSDSYANNFSYEGLSALFDYLEDYEDDTGEQVEFDLVALCCDFGEYENIQEIKDNYSDIESLEDLEGHTTVIPVYNLDGSLSDRLIIQNF